jgi:hypothetical protein
MASAPNFLERLRAVLVPTAGQALGATFLAMALLALVHGNSLLQRLGINSAILDASQTEFQTRFEAVLRSEVASQIALVTFWAVIGLVAYLVCWGIYNILIEARNEITLAAAYTNRTDYSGKHWGGPIHTLALKTLAAAGLAGIVGSLWYGVSFWLILSGGIISAPSLATGALAAVAVIGFAIHLYLVLAFIQLTFTPWYRAEAFTDTAA